MTPPSAPARLLWLLAYAALSALHLLIGWGRDVAEARVNGEDEKEPEEPKP